MVRHRPAAAEHGPPVRGLSWWFLVWNPDAGYGGEIVLGIAGSAALVTSYSLTRFLPEAVRSGIATASRE